MIFHSPIPKIRRFAYSLRGCMGYAEMTLKLPTDYSEKLLKKLISKEICSENFNFHIIRRSLDARNKRDIHFLTKIGVTADNLSGKEPAIENLQIPNRRGIKRKVIVTGCGPAGIFASLILQEAGFSVTIIEKGCEVPERTERIAQFEKTGVFDHLGGYCFGEGGAGTFSDGKLTSRTKSITLEKNFIFEEFIKAGAPEEIAYETYPHVGSDNLKKIIPALIKKFRELGGETLFGSEVTEINKSGDKITSVGISGRETGIIEGDHFIFANGHSSFKLYKLLISQGVLFTPKPFAIGFRVEHIQEELNFSMWRRRSLPGVKAAEYHLTADCDPGHAFTFCMCPGGKIVQSAPDEISSVVNGMSNFARNGAFANSAVVTPFSLEELAGKEITAGAALDLLEEMEHNFFNYRKSFDVPAARITDILHDKKTANLPETSFSFGIAPADMSRFFPKSVYDRLKKGLSIFCKKLDCFESGVAMGFESKTSAPIKCLRNQDLTAAPFTNLYICGEGSGYSGGIVSSAADGIKIAMKIAAV